MLTVLKHHWMTFIQPLRHSIPFQRNSVCKGKNSERQNVKDYLPVSVHVYRTPSQWVVEQQNTGDHISLHHGTRDAAVRYEVLDRLLLALRCDVLDDLEPLVGYLGV